MGDESLDKTKDKESKAPEGEAASQPPKKKKELTVISVPDEDVIAQEMADLFDEDRVTHQHGHTQPERD